MKTLASINLGAALFAPSGAVKAETNRPAEARWGIRSERTSAPTILDLARWFARRLDESVGLTISGPPLPAPDPGTDPTPPPPVVPDEACNPERVHYPTG